MKKITLKVLDVSGWISEEEDFKVGQIVTANLYRKTCSYDVYDLVHDALPFSIHVYSNGEIYIPGINDLKLGFPEKNKPKLMKRDTTSQHGIPLDNRRRRRLFRQVSKNTIREGGISYWKKQARNHCR